MKAKFVIAALLAASTIAGAVRLRPLPHARFTGEMPCFSQSGLPFIDYYRTIDGTYQYWSSTDECTVTVTKYDETRGPVKGTYRARVAQLSLPEPVYGDLVGCFSARREDLGPV
jgi:hypothetical protein